MQLLGVGFFAETQVHHHLGVVFLGVEQGDDDAILHDASILHLLLRQLRRHLGVQRRIQHRLSNLVPHQQSASLAPTVTARNLLASKLKTIHPAVGPIRLARVLLRVQFHLIHAHNHVLLIILRRFIRLVTR